MDMYDTDDIVFFCDRQVTKMQYGLVGSGYSNKDYLKSWRIEQGKHLIKFLLTDHKNYSLEAKKYALDVGADYVVALAEREVIRAIKHLKPHQDNDKLKLMAEHMTAEKLINGALLRLESMDELYAYTKEQMEQDALSTKKPVKNKP